MSAFDRIRNVAKGKASRIAGDLERRNPDAVYEAAIDGRIASLAEHKEIAATLVTQRNQIAAQLDGLNRELEKLMAALQGALQEGDDDTALVLEHRRQEVLAAVEAKTAELAVVTEQVEATKAALHQLREHTEALKREQVTAKAQLAAAEAAIEINDTLSGLSDSPTARALGSVRDSVEALKRRAHPGFLDEEGNSVQGRAEAMGRKAAENRARAELERLKADLAAKDEDDEDPG